MSTESPFQQQILLPPQVAGTGATEIDFTSTAVKAVWVVPGKCQIKEWGVVVTTTFSSNATKPIVKLGYQHPVGASTTYIQALTLGVTNTTLRKYTTNPDAVASGGPGTVTVGPALGGHTSALAGDTSLAAGTVIIADTKSMPALVLSGGDLLLVEVTQAATTGGKGVVFVNLEVAGLAYTTAYVQYDTTP